MPELPEVEVVRRGLAAHLPGSTAVEIAVLNSRSVRRQLGGAESFVADLRGRRFESPRRRGKFLWVPLAGADAMVAHLGMSGQFRLAEAGSERPKHCRVVIGLDTGSELRFVDQRMFGGLWISHGNSDIPPELGHIAPDVLDPGLELAALAHRIRTRRSAIKRVLLDQTVVSGIGNIYADEALWRAKLHGERPADQLSQRAVVRLLEAVQGVMGEALEQGGTSFDELYVNVNGESGYFSRALAVYGREGQPCERCGTAIRRVAFTNRSSHFCPACQRRR